MVYERIRKSPEIGDPCFDSNKNIFHREGYPRPNCTTYVQGVWLKVFGIDTYCRHNAGGWIDDAKKAKKYKISMTPKLGAIAVWKIPGTQNDGHVAIVEEIKNNGDIITSNSGWTNKPSEFKTMMWYEAEYIAQKGYNWTSNKSGKYYEFIGFIIPPVTTKEHEALFKVSAPSPLRMGAGKKHRAICAMKKNQTFQFDGQYDIIDQTKWLHGFYITNNEHNVPIRFGGWVEAKNLR